MTAAEPDPEPDAMQSTIDAEMALILDQYLQDQERGTALPRQQWLAKHPDHADRLAACLDGVELFGVGSLLGPGAKRKSDQTPAPESIGDFEILRELGRGGMGVVYEAREKSLDRIVALKVMRFGVVDPRALERFQREAETAGALHHTNIVPVYATGREGDTSWYAMQRIEGESLAHRINDVYGRSDRIPLEEILDVGIQAAEALDHAHQRSVVHRDVKPANLIVDGQQRVWLTDFGLARRLVDAGATMTGAIMGTPRYMSPEQADLRGTEVDHRTDVYSLGATLYEMATGQPPFAGRDPLKVITQIRYEIPTPARTIRPDLPRDIDVVLNKCLEKEADRRYVTAAELAEDLRAIRDDRAIRARAVTIFERAARWTRQHQTRVRGVGVAVIATAATMLLFMFAWQSYRESNLAAFRLRAASGPYMTSIRPVGQSSLSEDAVQLTVPMQEHHKLAIGDYDMMLAPHGRWSRNFLLPIAAGMPTELRLRNLSSESKKIPIKDAMATAVAGFDEPAIIVRRDGQLSRTTWSGQDAWSINVSQVAVTYTPLNEDSVGDGPADLTINFAHTADFAPSLLRTASLADTPQYCAPPGALKTPIDLNGDSSPDSIVAAIAQPALLAVDSQGKVLWAHAYDVNGISFSRNRPSRVLAEHFSAPGVTQLTSIADQDGDDVDDIVAVICYFRSNVKDIRTDACLAVISGKTGEPIRTIHPPSLKAIPGVVWPFDGVLRMNRGEVRNHSGLYFTTTRARYSMGQDNGRSSISWNGGRKTAVPSPLQFIHEADRVIAIYHAGKECRRYDLATGKEIGVPIKLAFTPAHRPRIARLGDGRYALIFHELLAQVSRLTGEFGTHLIARDLQGNALWERRIKFVEWADTTWRRNQADWPLVGDVNDDGVDELLIPTGRYRYQEKTGVQMLAAADGSAIWRLTDQDRYQFYRSAEDELARMAISSDVDGDGWRDWVTASIAGPPSPTATLNKSQRNGEVFVYVDWISGKNGDQIAWARHLIPVVSDKFAVTEIDAIRCDIPGGKNGVVEVDLVTGDVIEDLVLESMVLRFHPSSPDAIAIAAGMDVCPTEYQQHQATRVYYQRPGPYEDGAEQLVLLPEPDEQLLRLGEQQLLASWSLPSGRNLVALQGFEPTRLIVVDADTLQTIWASPRNESQDPEFTPVKNFDGSVDFLVQWESSDDAPTLIDGDSGREKWMMSAAPGGHIKNAKVFDGGKSLLVVGDGRAGVSGIGFKPPAGFRMSVVGAKSGVVRWSESFLNRAPRHNYPRFFDDLQMVDVNNDGTLDIVGPDQPVDQRILMIAAWDGKTGKQLWQRPLFKDGIDSDYFVSFCVFGSVDNRRVAYLGANDYGSGLALVNICDAATGGELITHEIANSPRLLHTNRRSQHNNVAIADCSPSPEQPRVGLLWADNNSVGRWTLFDVTDGQQIEESTWIDAPAREWPLGVWLKDVDEDAIPERITARRRPVLNSRGAYSGDEVVLSAQRIAGDDPIWEIVVPRTKDLRKIHWQKHAGSSLAWLEISDDRFVLVDAVAGRVLESFDQPSFDAGNLPLAFAVAESEQNVAIQLMVPARDGVVKRTISTIPIAAVPRVIHQQFDPRRQHRLITQGMMPPAVDTMARDAVRSVIALIVLVLIPLGYFGTMLRRRQWSLSWMLLAPPIVMLFLMVGNSRWIHEPNLSFNLLSGVGWLLVITAFYYAFFRRDASDGFGGKGWLLLLLLVLTAFVMMLGSCYLLASDPSVQYVFPLRDAMLLLLTSVLVAGLLYWVARVIVGFVRRVIGAARLETAA